ncbi:MAG: hypothetical protein ACRDEA_05970, partial [Microcystaceae cyanobacterium]
MDESNIYILSYGINPYRDISVRTLEILKKCQEVYVLMSSIHLASFLNLHNVNYTDITNICPTQLIIDAAKDLELSVSVIPAVSFINAILAHLQISIGTEGFAVYEATNLVRNKITIDNRVHCLIAQIGTFNSE